jgi:hypothetical protein
MLPDRCFLNLKASVAVPFQVNRLFVHVNLNVLQVRIWMVMMLLLRCLGGFHICLHLRIISIAG